MSSPVTPEAIGLSETRLQRVYDLLDEKVRAGFVGAAALRIGRHGKFLPARGFGERGEGNERVPASGDNVFLVASITKPVTAIGTMLLVEAGLVTLNQPVTDFIPEFGGHGKDGIKIWHLLTHTSGLPDMPPQNIELRRAHAPLDQFLARIYDCDLLFPPGTNVSYQSCGFAIQGEIIERVTGQRLRDFLAERLFTPVKMQQTSLGWREDLGPKVVESMVPDEQVGTDWHWNTAYWRNLGVPWGGMFSTVADLGNLLQLFLDRGRAGDQAVLSPATVRAMTRDQLAHHPTLPPTAYTPVSWGLGWEIRGKLLGDLASPGAFGHGGATGTMAWADPERQLVCILLTNQPRVWQQEQVLLPRVSNLVAAACL
ncbi:MAG: beta-lactamase family protein [Chloroflexi bacterium]|nr:beta-lactamase family protein [Chloroflexota bacterium]